MSGPLEKHIVESIVKYLRTLPGCVVRKRHGTPFGITGDPDIYGAICGRHFEIEVKRSGNRLTPLQERRLEEWRAAGAIVGIAHSPQEAREILDHPDDHGAAIESSFSGPSRREGKSSRTQF